MNKREIKGRKKYLYIYIYISRRKNNFAYMNVMAYQRHRFSQTHVDIRVYVLRRKIRIPFVLSNHITRDILRGNTPFYFCIIDNLLGSQENSIYHTCRGLSST